MLRGPPQGQAPLGLRGMGAWLDRPHSPGPQCAVTATSRADAQCLKVSCYVADPCQTGGRRDAGSQVTVNGLLRTQLSCFSQNSFGRFPLQVCLRGQESLSLHQGIRGLTVSQCD